MRSLRTNLIKTYIKTLPHKYINKYVVSYEYLFIYDIKKKKLAQKLRCDSFVSVNIFENDYVKIKLWDKKKQKEGIIQFLP